MPRSATNSLKNAFRKGEVGFWIIIVFSAILIIYLLLLVSSRLVRLYTFAYAGNSKAMYILADEYYKISSDLVKGNFYKGDYWLRRSASKGNFDAIFRINRR